MNAAPGSAGDLCAFINAAPTPAHAVEVVARRLAAADFDLLDESERWPTGPGAHMVVRGGSLVAWRTTGAVDPTVGVRLVGAHTDSPNLRLKPHPDATSAGWRQVLVETYGGVLANSWLDRDLGLAGRLVLSGAPGSPPEVVLVAVNEPWLRIPQLAIHLDRAVATEGLRLDPQRHLTPVWGVDPGAGGGIVARVAEANGIDPSRVVAADLMCFDVDPVRVTGASGEFVSGARLDNLVSCWAGTSALAALDVRPDGDPAPIPVLALYDHEEVGSTSATGAGSTLVADVLERIGFAGSLDTEDRLRLRTSSWALSVDGAHATHPNYPERHDPAHHIRIDGGIVVKYNANQRYATDAVTVGTLDAVASAAGVPLQHFVMRNDLPCGSTIGPISAARLGIPTVDIGVAQLAMHSVRELCGATDAERLVGLLDGFFSA